MHARSLLILLLASPLAAVVSAQAAERADTEAEALVRRLEEHQASLDSMSASFTQSYRSAATAQEIVERGRLFVRRPFVRFDYRRPDKKVFLVEADGTTLAYVPADRSAVRSALPDEAPHLRLLRGDGDLLEDFSVREVHLKDPMVPDSRQLKLIPRRALRDVEAVSLEISVDARRVYRVLLLDSLGNESELRFEDVKENPHLGDDTFRLKLPPGVELTDYTEGSGR